MSTQTSCLSVLVLSAVCSVAQAQNVYKCEEGGVTIFSQSPCAANAEVVDTSRSRQGVGGVRPQAVTDMMRDAAGRSIELAHTRCLRVAEQDVIGPANRRLGAMSSRLQYLQVISQPRYGDSLITATQKAGYRSEIGSLQAAMATERLNADQQLRARAEMCDQQRQQAVDRLAGAE